MRTLQEKYNAIQENKFSKNQFLIEARQQHPNLVTQYNSYGDAVSILKNRGVISEQKKQEQTKDNTITDEALRRGIDYELELMGLDSAGDIDMETLDKARNKALTNLRKDHCHYLHILTGEKSKINKHDQMEKATPSNTVDKDNGFKKADLRETVIAELKRRIAEGRRRKIQGGKVVTENDYESGGYVESMGPVFDKAVEMLLKAFTEWMDGPMTKPVMVPHAKKDVMKYVAGELDRIISIEDDIYEVEEEAKPDYIDADGDGDKEEPMKKAFQDKEKAELKEAFKKIIKNILSEKKEPLNEAAAETLESYINYENENNTDLAKRVRENATKLAKHVAEVEESYLKLREAVADCCKACGDHLGPELMEAFKRDLAPVVEKYFTIEYKGEAPVQETGQDDPDALQEAIPPRPPMLGKKAQGSGKTNAGWGDYKPDKGEDWSKEMSKLKPQAPKDPFTSILAKKVGSGSYRYEVKGTGASASKFKNALKQNIGTGTVFADKFASEVQRIFKAFGGYKYSVRDFAGDTIIAAQNIKNPTDNFHIEVRQA